MGFLSKDQVTELTTEALKTVADFNGSILNYEFTNFQDYQKQVFTNKLVELINQQPYLGQNGQPDPTQYHDVSLSMTIVNAWVTMSDCINYVFENQTVANKTSN
ncbi:hypothetical protein AAON49_01235 [Pseudotenacibaculum sp. MALMAid0570]|uniref:hypothetical protein n=1 Tax=Pseudotenacibaculum sp. MALMAid0570 TaxID=3143938 RepID=UPI0032E029B1